MEDSPRGHKQKTQTKPGFIIGKIPRLPDVITPGVVYFSLK